MAGPSRTDVCYPPGSDDFSDLGYKRRLVLVDPDLDFPLDARKRSNRKRLGASGSDTCPKAKSNEPKAAVTLPFRPCGICFKDHNHPRHYNPRCPYWDIVPQGTTVGPGYQVICRGCGNDDFDLSNWVCNYCGRIVGKVSSKYCIICNVNKQHDTKECPKDQVAAARIKFARERLRQAGALVPVKPHYVPAPPPGFVNMEEAKNT